MVQYIIQDNALRNASSHHATAPHISTLQPIDSREISVVIQGPIFTHITPLAPEGITRQVLKALRQHLPYATLILSTWKGQPVEDLDADITLQLDDPGTTNFYKPKAKAENLYNNGNRLIYSTQAGLAQVKTKYTLKIRSDLLLFHPLFSSYFNQFHHVDAPWHVLEQRIIGFPVYSLKYESTQPRSASHKNRSTKIQPRPFHVSDWAYFGLTADMQKLFDCPLMDEPATSRWFETRPKPTNDLWPDRLWRYSPEQYIVSNLAQRTLGITLEHASQDDADILQSSERFIANNFIILDQHQWGLWSLKLKVYQDQLPPELLKGLYSHQVWYRDYQKYSINTPTLMEA
ncbi:WavE lipopolysaccharide synthesis family protein [Alkanindiges illinoisensis]|uniref:WavE lipopolysaccharide synthesis family protein n=1 Tax=Alkanindiges illinoisensis TaxID=197183 RepID=UPI00146FA649|nr:WavE lipopolysaccharide synthesis family protein [Alkanindiges illinoisensis]